MQENEAQAADNSDASIVPTSYDLRTKSRTSEVRNQGSYGTCWSFAALGALESSLLPEESEQYSVDHMTLCNGFNMTQNDGGEYQGLILQSPHGSFRRMLPRSVRMPHASVSSWHCWYLLQQ